MNFYQELGPLVFGTRLKRISEYFLSEINKLYSDLQIPFEASWFGVFYLLDKHNSLSIFEIAEKLEVSHSAISQLVKNLEDKNLLVLSPSADDGRKKDIALSDEGKILLEKIKPVWKGLEIAMTEVLMDDQVLKKLTALENTFEKEPLSEKIKSKINV